MQENYEAKAIASPAEVKRVELRDMETDVEQCFIESGDDHLKVLSSPDSLSSSFLNSHVNSPLNNPVKESQIPRRQLMPKSWRRDFTTIDFLLETHHNRIEAMKFRGENSKRKYIGWFLNFQYSLQAWIVLILVGIATAMNTAFIHYAADWLSGFKFGVCSHGFFIEKSKCCLDQVNEHCPAWKTWSEILFRTNIPFFNSTLHILMTILFSVCCAWLVQIFSKKSSGGGIPEVKSVLGGFIIKQILGFWVLFIKTIGLILVEGAGLSLGSRGPLIHISCCWGNIVSRFFRKYNENEAKRREIISAAAASGISAGFGSPIGGVLFSSEALSAHFPPKTMWRSFVCAVATALFLKFMYAFPDGKIVPFQIKYQHNFLWFEILPFCIIGMIGGLLGALFIRLNLYIHSARTRFWNDSPIIEVAFIALATSCFGLFTVFLRESNVNFVASLFEVCENLNPFTDLNSKLCHNEKSLSIALMLIFVAIVKFILTLFTIGARIPAGLFMPSIVIGACIGRAIGILMSSLERNNPQYWIFRKCLNASSVCIYPGVYAIVGAAAMLGGTTRMTVSLAVTIFEVTGSLVFIIPIMISVVCSKLVSDAFGKYGIYDLLVALKGYPYVPRVAEANPNLTAESIMSSNPVCISVADHTVKSLKSLLKRHSFAGFPVVRNVGASSSVIGYITRVDLRAALDIACENGSTHDCRVILSSSIGSEFSKDSVDISSHVDLYPVIVDPGTPLDILLDFFKNLGVRCVMVVKDNDIVGIIKKKDIVQIISTVTAASSLLPISPTDFVKASFSKEEISEESISDKKENEEPLLDSLSPLDSL